MIMGDRGLSYICLAPRDTVRALANIVLSRRARQVFYKMCQLGRRGGLFVDVDSIEM